MMKKDKTFNEVLDQAIEGNNNALRTKINEEKTEKRLQII